MLYSRTVMMMLEVLAVMAQVAVVRRCLVVMMTAEHLQLVS